MMHMLVIGVGIVHVMWTTASLLWLLFGPRLPGEQIQDCYVVIDMVRFDLLKYNYIWLYSVSFVLGIVIIAYGIVLRTRNAAN